MNAYSSLNDESPPLNPIKDLPKLLIKVINTIDPEKGYEILKRRYGLGGSEIYSLRELAAYYKISRTAIQNIEEILIRKIQKSFLGSVSDSLITITGEITDEYKKLRNTLTSGDKIITLEEVIALTEQQLSIKCNNTDIASIRFLLKIFGLLQVPKGYINPKHLNESWSTENKNEFIPNVISIRRTFYRLFYKTVTPFSLLDIKLTLIDF